MYDNYSVKCGKLSFSTKYDAELKIEQREFDDSNWTGRAYECSNCSKWHITTNKDDSTDDILSQSRRMNADRSFTKRQKKNNTVEGSRIVNSFGNGSGSSIFDSLDEESLRKLGLIDD